MHILFILTRYFENTKRIYITKTYKSSALTAIIIVINTLIITIS